MDTKKLRQKILDLAIHGKLVPQDPNDEPASVLLERIKAEKEHLVKEGKIKRSKKSAKTSDTPHYENVPFEVPDSWVWTRLGEIFTLQAGKNITAKDISAKQDTDHCYPCYGGNGLRGYVSNYNKEGHFPLIGRQGALCGNVNEANGKFYATEHAVVVDTYCKTNVHWVINTLLYLNLNQYATSTAQPGLSVSAINEVMIPVPPLKEQQRISQSIENWFSLIDQLEQEKSDLQTVIKQAKSRVLDLAIHGKLVPQNPNDEPAIELLKRINPDFTPCDNGHYTFDVPSGWITTNLGSIFNVVSAKRILKSDWKHSGVPFYRAREIAKLSIYGLVDNELYISEEHYNSLKEKFPVPKASDIMISAVGTIGKCYIVKESDKFYYKDASVLCLCNDYQINAKYIYHIMRSEYMLKQMYDNSKGTTVDTITIEKAKQYILPLPPLAEQQRIVAKIEETFSIFDGIQNSLEA